jgi:hypothetical protein
MSNTQSTRSFGFKIAGKTGCVYYDPETDSTMLSGVSAEQAERLFDIEDKINQFIKDVSWKSGINVPDIRGFVYKYLKATKI